MKQNVTVVGAGLVGRLIARELSLLEYLDVSVLDVNESHLDQLQDEFRGSRQCADVFSKRVFRKHCESAALVVNALPGELGFRFLKQLVDVGKDVVDIAFFGEDASELNASARKSGARVLYDCGVAPGLSNLCVAKAQQQLGKLHSVRIFVGGLPVKRTYPFEYAAVFSPSDVIEEYLRPARCRVGGVVVAKEALSELELIDVPEVGTLEAFQTDGLRSLLKTIDCPFMEEKTLRYPGHRDRMHFLREAGFLGSEELLLAGNRTVSAREVTELLFRRAWQLSPGEAEFTYLCVRAQSASDLSSLSFELLDRYDPLRGETSMARTTGFTACGFVTELLRNSQLAAGVYAPEELLGFQESVFKFCETRGVHIKEHQG